MSKDYSRPCKWCKHLPRQHNDPWEKYYCKNCECPWFEPMSNLEYLEFQVEKKQYLLTK